MSKITESARNMECQTEEWRAVVGWHGYYEVSSAGRVRSCLRTVIQANGKRRTFYPHILKHVQDKGGYAKVTLCGGKRVRTVLIHVLVAENFINRPIDAQLVRHFDGDASNNRASNLRWGTYRDNELDKERHGRKMCGEQHPLAVLSVETVKAIKRLLAEGVSHLEISRRLPVKRSNVWSIAKGHTWGHVENN